MQDNVSGTRPIWIMDIPCRKIGFIAEAQMPLADHVSVVTKPLEILRHQFELCGQAIWLLRHQGFRLAPGVYGVSAGHQG